MLVEESGRRRLRATRIPENKAGRQRQESIVEDKWKWR